MPTALNDGVLASSIVDNFSGEDFVVPLGALRTVAQGATFIVAPDGISRLPISREKAALVSKGMSLEQAIEIAKPGSASEGSPHTTSFRDTPVVTISQQKDSVADNNHVSHHAPEPSKFVQAQGAKIREEAAYLASVNPPSIRRNFGTWAGYQGTKWFVNPLRRAFGRPEKTLESYSVSGGAPSIPSVANREIGVQSGGQIGPTPAGPVSSADETRFNEPGENAGPIRESHQDEKSSVSLPSAKSDHLSGGSTGTEIKKGILGAVGNKVGGGVAGMSTKVKGAIDTVQLAGRAAAGDVSAMIQLGAKGLKWAWDNKEKIIKYGVGIGGGLIMAPLLALYGAIAPWLAALSPATLAGAGIGGAAGFIISGGSPLGMVAGAGLGAAIAANWGAITAGVGNALASIAGIGGALGSAIGGLGAALAAPAAAIGGLTVVAVTFTTFFVAPQARNQIIFGSDNFQNMEIQVEKTATPNQVKNDTAAEIEYTVKITNSADHEWDITIKDTDIKIYKNGVTAPLVMPDPTAPLPTKLTKTNDSKNPLVITFKKLAIKAGQYNDSQIKNIVEVSATDPTTKETKNFTTDATVVIGDIIDHPFGFPVGGILSSVDEDPCGDHWGGFFGVNVTGVHGIDIVGGANTPVVSTLTGRVRAAGFRDSGTDERNDVGGYVYIESNDGNFIAGFQHMNAPDPLKIKVGAIVNRGEVIGTIYPTSLPTTSGPHLHYQVIQRVGGVWQNVSFSDPARAGACMADPSSSVEANIVPYVLTKPPFDPNTCGKNQVRKYTPTGPVTQDVVCK